VVESLRYPDTAASDGELARGWRVADVERVRLAGTDPRIPRGTIRRPRESHSSIDNGVRRTARACRGSLLT
jgi:hypothetical protein